MDNQSHIRFTAEIAEWFNQRWDQHMGAIDGKDISFLTSLLEAERPNVAVEIGCASGLSTSILASFLDQIGNARLVSFDIDDRFYMDRSKEVGYLLQEALPSPSIDISVKPGTTSLDVDAHVEGPIDFCFIDAAHKHPWPLIDTLAVLPLMKPGGVIVHHDLQMFRSQGFYATGPKILLDQVPRELAIRHWSVPTIQGFEKLKSRAIDGNIFAIRVPEEYRSLGLKLSQGFYIGWDGDSSKRVPDSFARKFGQMVSQHYDPGVEKAFKIGLGRYNPPADQQELPQSLFQKFVKRLSATRP